MLRHGSAVFLLNPIWHWILSHSKVVFVSIIMEAVSLQQVPIQQAAVVDVGVSNES